MLLMFKVSAPHRSSRRLICLVSIVALVALLPRLPVTAEQDAAQPNLVKDINRQVLALRASEFASVGSSTYFLVDVPHGEELWKSDGTQVGTVLVKNIGQQ